MEVLENRIFKRSIFYFSDFVCEISKKTEKTKTKKQEGYPQEKWESFFLFFITFSILSIFGALETA